MTVGLGATDVGVIELGNFNSANRSDLEVGILRIAEVSGSQGKMVVRNSSTLLPTNAYIGVNGTGELEVDSGLVQGGSMTIGWMSSSSGIVTFKNQGTYTANIGDITVGSNGTGVLNIDTGGSTHSEVIIVGRNVGGNGTVNVGGQNASWSSNTLTVGQDGTGNVNVNGGGLATVHTSITIGASGQVNLDGGRLDVGDLTIQTSGLLNWNSGTLGFLNGLTVDGTGPLGATVNVTSGRVLDGFASGISVGEGGLLNISGGGNVNGLAAFVSGTALQPATLLVDGSGSEIEGSIVVGDNGVGVVEVTYGGQIGPGQILLGINGGQGTLRIDGTGALVTGLSTEVGDGPGSVASLEIVDGGTFIGDFLVDVGAGGGNGTITVSGPGSSLVMTGEYQSLQLGLGGTGVFTVSSGGSITSNKVLLAVGTIGTAQGTVSGAGSQLVVNNTMAIGPYSSNPNASGTLTVSNGAAASIGGALDLNAGGSLVLTKGSLSTDVLDMASGSVFKVDISGTTAGIDFGQIDVATSGVLGGSLEIAYVDGFSPSGNDSFTIIDALGGTLSGVFSNITVTGDSGTPATITKVLYFTDQVWVQVYFNGDLDEDGFVGIADLNVVLGNWNQNVTSGDRMAGDPSGDGFVGIEDLNAVLGQWNFGTLPPPLDGSSSVPEPGTAALALLCLTPGLMNRKIRNVLPISYAR